MLVVALRPHKVIDMFHHGKNHKSPNAGYPEAALAIILNCRFGGSNVYHGKLVEKPYIGTNDREIGCEDMKIASRVNVFTMVLFVAGYVGISSGFFLK